MSIKDFVIIGKLGEGAYSSVYKVQRVVDSQIYALKKVKMNNLSAKQQQNALNQVRILASVHSPTVIGYKQAFIESNSLCIIMEFADDGDLYQKITDHQKQHTSFDEDSIWRTLVQVLKGLTTLHDLNILHRDLKSANVFMNKDGTVKLGDMNVSKIAKNGLLYTQTGTPYYASPEVWKDKPYDSKSDIWSLGCVIYEMTTLKPPFRAEDMDGLYKKVTKGSYPKIGDQHSKALAKIIKEMLQVNPANRPSANTLLKSLSSKMKEIDYDAESEPEHNHQLLQTIRADKKLHYLTDRLPKSNYQNGFDQHERANTKMATGTRSSKNTLSYNYPNSRSINLPKLDRIIVKNSQNKSPVVYHQSTDERRKDGSKILKIEGRGNSHKTDNVNPLALGNNLYNPVPYNIELDPAKKVVARNIKAQLRKIYNLKPAPKSPTKMHRRNLELPKIG